MQLRREPVELALGDRLAAHQLAAAPVIELGQAQVGLGGLQQGVFHRTVELHQRLPGLDLLPRLELHVLDRAGNLQGEVHPLQGLERTHRRQALLPRLFDRGGHRHADRRFGRGKDLDLLIDGKGFIAPQQQDDEQHNGQHDQHATTQHIPVPWKKLRQTKTNDSAHYSEFRGDSNW